jgi:hypothetical protein
MLGSKLGITDHTPILQLEKLVQDEGGFKPNHTLLIYPMFIFDFSSLQLHPSTPPQEFTRKYYQSTRIPRSLK